MLEKPICINCNKLMSYKTSKIARENNFLLSLLNIYNCNKCNREEKIKAPDSEAHYLRGLI